MKSAAGSERSPTRQRIDRALSRAVKANDRRAVFAALAERLAREVEQASARELAALTGRLLEVLAELERLDGPAGQPAKPVDSTAEFAARVADKRGRSG